MEAAKDLLRRAVELDSAMQYSEALICYEEGIQNIIRLIPGRSEEQKKELRRKAEEYLKRAEEVKKRKLEMEEASEKVQYVGIKEGATGYSYEKVLGNCLDGNVEWVEVEDPYIRARHQVHNFVRLCELLVKKSGQRLKSVKLNTGGGESDQQRHLEELRASLAVHGVALHIVYSDTLHDRQIRFSNGWIVKLGRGLDYFKEPEGQFTIGFSDYDLRPCHETTIEVFHKLNTRKIKS